MITEVFYSALMSFSYILFSHALCHHVISSSSMLYVYYFMITSKDRVQTPNAINFQMLTFSYACYSHHGKVGHGCEVAFLISVINWLTG